MRDAAARVDAVVRADVAEALATLGLAADGPLGGSGPWIARTGTGDEHLVTATRVADEPAWERLRHRTTALLDLAHEAVVPLLGAVPVGDRTERTPRTVVLVWMRPDDAPVPVRAADDVVALVVAASRAVVAARTCGVHVPGDDAVEALRGGPGGLLRLWLGPWWDAADAPCADPADATRGVAAAVALRVARAGTRLPRALLDLLADGVGPRPPAPGTFAVRALETLPGPGLQAAAGPGGEGKPAAPARPDGAHAGRPADTARPARAEGAEPTEPPARATPPVDWRALVTAGPPRVVPPRGARRRARGVPERVPVPVVAGQRPALPRPTGRTAGARRSVRPAGGFRTDGRTGPSMRVGPHGGGGARRAAPRVLAALATIGVFVGVATFAVLPSGPGPGPGSSATPDTGHSAAPSTDRTAASGTADVRTGPTGTAPGAADVVAAAQRATLGRVATLAAVSPVPEPERAARERDVVDALREHVAPGPVLESDAALVRAVLAGEVDVPDVRAEVLGVELVALDETSARVVVAYVLRADEGGGGADGTPAPSEDELRQELTLVPDGGSWRVRAVVGPTDAPAGEAGRADGAAGDAGPGAAGPGTAAADVTEPSDEG